MRIPVPGLEAHCASWLSPQYANPAFENVMGYQTGELLGAASLEKKVDLLAAIQPCTKLSKVRGSLGNEPRSPTSERPQLAPPPMKLPCGVGA